MSDEQRGIAYAALGLALLVFGVLAAVRRDWFYVAMDFAGVMYLALRVRQLTRGRSER